MKSICIFILLLNFIPVKRTASQSLKKIYESDAKISGSDNNRVLQLEDGIVIEEKDQKIAFADYIGTNGLFSKHMKAGESYCSDSLSLFVVRIHKGFFQIDTHLKKDPAIKKTIRAVKSVEQILEEDGLDLSKFTERKNKIIQTIDRVFLVENKILIIVKFDLGSEIFYTAYFMFNLESPSEVFRVNPEFPKLNDNAPKQNRFWNFITYDHSCRLFFYSRTYILNEGIDKGKNALTIAAFNKNFDLVRTIDFHQKYNFDPSSEYLTFHFIYEKPKGWIIENSFIRYLDNRNEYVYGFLLQVFDSSGKLVWKHLEKDPVFESYNSFIETAENLYDHSGNIFHYHFFYALNDYTYTFNSFNGELLNKEKIHILNSKDKKISDDLTLDFEIKSMLNTGKYKDFRIFILGKKKMVLFRDKEKKYSVYVK